MGRGSPVVCNNRNRNGFNSTVAVVTVFFRNNGIKIFLVCFFDKIRKVSLFLKKLLTKRVCSKKQN